jgi:hypothetical protein
MDLGRLSLKKKMSTRKLLGGRKRPARRADNHAAIYEPNVRKLWEPQLLATLRASTACVGITLIYSAIHFKSPFVHVLSVSETKIKTR